MKTGKGTAKNTEGDVSGSSGAAPAPTPAPAPRSASAQPPRFCRVRVGEVGGAFHRAPALRELARRGPVPALTVLRGGT